MFRKTVHLLQILLGSELSISGEIITEITQYITNM